MPAGLAFNSVFNGAVFALWPVMWIVVNALLLYNVAVKSGRFEAFRAWVIEHLPNDRRVILVVIGFCFGALLEGVAGFGTPVAITSSLLILCGFPALEALVFVLIFNTAPVAFGALGVPVTVLGAVTGLPAQALGAMIGRQLPVLALLLPFYVMAVYGGWRSVRALWPVLLVAGGSFAASQFISSNFLDYALTDVLVLARLADLHHPVPAGLASGARPGIRGLGGRAGGREQVRAVAPWQGWLPWLIVSGVVIAWTHLGWAAIGQSKVQWPGLHNAISITLYNAKPYAAVWLFQPLGSGTAILVATLLTALAVRIAPRDFLGCIGATLAPDPARGGHRDADHRPRLSDELFRHGLYARPRRRIDRQAVRAALALPGLDRGDALGQRHLGQRPVRQSAGGGGAPARPQSRAVRRDQFVRRRDGQDGVAAEHRDRRVGDQSQEPGRRGLRADLQAAASC